VVQVVHGVARGGELRGEGLRLGVELQVLDPPVRPGLAGLLPGPFGQGDRAGQLAQARAPVHGSGQGLRLPAQVGLQAGTCLAGKGPGGVAQAVGPGGGLRRAFGFAQGKEQDGGNLRYVGFSYGKRTSLIMDSSLLLIDPVTAAAYMESLRAAEEASRAKAADAGGSATTLVTGEGGVPPRVEDSGKGSYPTGGGAPSAKKQFYASIDLDPIQAKRQFADLVDEVVQQFILRPGVKVRIAVEIQAESPTGFDDGLQRAVKENCNVLKFKSAEFEAGE